jgi:hypothetical protein
LNALIIRARDTAYFIQPCEYAQASSKGNTSWGVSSNEERTEKWGVEGQWQHAYDSEGWQQNVVSVVRLRSKLLRVNLDETESSIEILRNHRRLLYLLISSRLKLNQRLHYLLAPAQLLRYSKLYRPTLLTAQLHRIRMTGPEMSLAFLGHQGT